jgi:hypothetical protein
VLVVYGTTLGFTLALLYIPIRAPRLLHSWTEVTMICGESNLFEIHMVKVSEFLAASVGDHQSFFFTQLTGQM